MSSIPATNSLHPTLERSPASLTGLRTVAVGAPPSEDARTFAGVFRSVEEGAVERQSEEEDLSDTGLAASLADVTRTQPQEGPLPETGLPVTAAASGPRVGSAPALSDATDRHAQVVPMPSEKVSSGMGNVSLSEPIKDHLPKQDTLNSANRTQPLVGQPQADEGRPPSQGQKTPWAADYTAAPPVNQSQGPAPETSQEGSNQMDQDARAAARTELEERDKWLLVSRAGLAKPQPRAPTEFGLSLPPGMRNWTGLEGPSLAALAGQSEFYPDNASDSDPTTGSPREARFGSGPSLLAQRDLGPSPLAPLAMRSPGLSDLNARDAFSLVTLFADATVTDLGDEGSTPAGTEVSDWRVALSAGPNQPLNALARPDLAQALARQIAVAVQSSDGGKPTVDLRLAPEELGRVRLRVSSHEGVVTVAVVAERSETLDLLRRHVEALARGLLDVGYQEARFSFAGQNSGENAAKAPKAQGFHQAEEQGLGPVLDMPLPPTLLSPAMAGARINVLI